MENPDFIPEGDSEWMNDLLKSFQPSQHDSEPEGKSRIDLDTFSDLEKSNILVAGLFIDHTYTNFISSIKDLDRQALDMMRGLAFFLENFGFEKEGQAVRFGDSNPSVSVRHAQISLQLKLQEIEDMLEGALEGTDRCNQLQKLELHYNNLFEVSKQAVTFEDRRKQRDQKSL